MVGDSRRRALRATLAGALIALLLTACGDATERSDADRITLRVATLTGAATPRRQLSLQSGAFDGAAYDIEWVDFGATKDALEAIASGAADVGLHLQAPAGLLSAGNADPAWTTADRPFAIIGATTVAEPAGNRILVTAGSAIDAVTDLQGMKIGMSKGGLSQYFLLLVAAEVGLTDFEPVYMPPADLGAALTSGAVDAVAGGVNLIPLVADGTARSLRDSFGMYEEFEVHVARNAVLTDPAYDAALRDLLVRNEHFNDWARDHQDEVAAVHSSTLGFSAEGAAASAKRFWGVRVTTASRTPMLADMAARFLEAGVTATEIDLGVVVDTRFDSTP